MTGGVDVARPPLARALDGVAGFCAFGELDGGSVLGVDALADESARAVPVAGASARAEPVGGGPTVGAPATAGAPPAAGAPAGRASPTTGLRIAGASSGRSIVSGRNSRSRSIAGRAGAVAPEFLAAAAELTVPELAIVFAAAGRAASLNGVAAPEVAVAGAGAAAAGLAVKEPLVAELSVPELTGTEPVGAELVGATVVPGTSPAPDPVAGSARSKSATAVAEAVALLIASGDVEPPTAGAVAGRLLSVAVPRSSEAICASGPSNGSRGSGARSVSGRAAGSGGPSGISGPASLRGSKGWRGTREAASIVRALQ